MPKFTSNTKVSVKKKPRKMLGGDSGVLTSKMIISVKKKGK